MMGKNHVKMSIKFRKEIRHAKFQSPLKNYESEEQIVEHRYDPLTGHGTVITTGRFQYIKKLFESDSQEIARIVEKTKIGCPFCPEKLALSTPKFSPNIVKEGKVVVGDSILFPSLFAHMDHNAIAVLCEEHYLQLKELAPEKLGNAFKAGLSYIKRLSHVYGKTFYACFIENYFPLSGSTIIHPHMQVIVSDLSFNLLKELLEKSEKYYANYKKNYWLDLIEEEEKSERFVGIDGDIVWFTPYAPLNTYEVWAVSKKCSSFLDLSNGDLETFSKGISKVMNFFQDEGLSCFNLALYSGPLGEDSGKYFRLGLRIVGRSGYKQPFVSDIWGLQAIMMEGESYDTPEDMAQRLKKYF